MKPARIASSLKTARGALLWAVLMLSLSLAAKFAQAKGYIDSDTVVRVIAMNGLFVAYLGNRMPKDVAPYGWAQKVRRFGGWSLFLSGLLDAGLWIFAPIPVAATIGSAAIVGGILLTIGYCFWVRGRMRQSA